MMFSMEKCLGRSGNGTAEEAELFAGGGEGLGKEGVPSDEVASAVAAVSDEIGDILKDELGDADRADRIGAELADLSAELGLLAGLADGEPQQDFPSLFEIAMGHRGSGSGSSSSSWSGGRGGRQRRHSRSQRAPRRRPIAKNKEMSRRCSAAVRRAVIRVRRVEVVSDASDVGADSDSDDQWTELDDASGSSDSSSLKEAAAVDVDCNGYQHKASAEAPAMGQFLLPLLSADAPAPHPEHFLIRHEDILQLLASAEESVREDLPLEEESQLEPTNDILSGSEMLDFEDAAVTAEEEAALLHYVCGIEAERANESCAIFTPLQEWLLGVFHSWCEISALMFTLRGTNMSVEMVTEEWVYCARFGCHCRLCLCLANNADALYAFIRDVVWALAHCGSTVGMAARMVRALRPRGLYDPDHWDLAVLRRAVANGAEQGASIIHEQLTKLAAQSDTTRQIVNDVCMCRQFDKPMEKEYAVERFCKILENFKAASTITFKVEMIPVDMSCVADASRWGWVGAARARLQRYLRPHQRASTRARLADMAGRSTPIDLSAWSGYKHRCDCLTPRTLCAQQRKQLLSGLWGRPMFSSGHLRAAIISFFGMMEAVNEFNGAKPETSADGDKPPNEIEVETTSRELQQGDGTGAKPPEDGPESVESMGSAGSRESMNSGESVETADSVSDSDANSGTGSLGLSTSSSLDSASELLLAAAAAVESGGSEGEAAPGELCRTVRHLMRSIASIERLMDRVLKHCDEWPAPPTRNDHEARKRVDMGLSEVDRKLMAMYRRLPEVHRRQLQVYRKQKKLSTVCMQLVGGRAPAPPPPGSPPPSAPHQPCRALCPEYHLQRFKEVRRKVMHMRDQQLYYHRLRMWLEDQLRQERESLPECNLTLPRRKRRTLSPKVPRLTTGSKRKLKPASPSLISKPHKILQMLKHKAPAQTTQLLTEDLKEPKAEADPPEAFPLEREDNVSDTDTIVGEKETVDMCKEMKECLAKFSNFALNNDGCLPEDFHDFHVQLEGKYPESVSPPLQEMSPTTPEPMPVYSSKPNQRLLSVNKFLNKDDKGDFSQQIAPEIMNIPLNARRTPILVKDEKETVTEVEDKDPNIYKYVSFGIEIKKAMEECQNIINSYNSIKDGKNEDEGQLSLEQICEVMMTLDKNSAEFLDKIDTEDSVEVTANTKLAELVENMPQILANMPEIASKLSEFANASFELPEFASIMNSIPEVNNEAQLTPETLKQIRELKLTKTRDSVKVTKNTAKRKTQRRIKNNIESNDIIGTMTFELDNKDIVELLKDEKDLQALMKNKNREDFKDLLFSISAQVVINKVFEYLKQNKSPVLAKCLEDDREVFAFPKNSLNSEMYSKASTLFDNSVKDALSMEELRDLVKSRFNSWKHYVASKFKGIPVEILENEIEAMLDKFYSYIQDLAGKNYVPDPDRLAAKLDELKRHHETHRDSDSDSRESVRQILLTTSAGNTLDILIMKFPKLTPERKEMVKGLKFKYMNVLRRCCESQPLANWILTDPETAVNVIQDLMNFQIKKPENVPDFSTMSSEKKRDYFIGRLRDVNRQYMETLPKQKLSGDDWLVMLYKLEQCEEKLKENFNKAAPQPVKTSTASEAEILAAKGLSKIIGKASIRVVKKADPPKKKETEKPKEKVETDDKKCKNDALLAKCEAILTSKGEKSLLDSFYTIKSYITQGLPVPETYKKHVISICSSIDAKLLDEDLEESLKSDKEDEDGKEKPISPQNHEELAKYSAQALRNAKQTLNAVAFQRISLRNGQSKSESDVCDTPKTDCKWTNDCVCNSCKDNDSVCLGDMVKQCYDGDKKVEKKKEVKKPVVKPKPVAKACENVNHQQHVCKVGHGGAACAGEGTEQPCTCCYCTVFGHAPPMTTPVPRNFNETRERLRSILNKKKQQCKSANGEPEPPATRAPSGVQTPPIEPPAQPKPTTKPPPVAPKPPVTTALPKTQPPNLTPAQVQQKRQSIDIQQKQLADKMAQMAVSDKPPPAAAQATNKPKVLQRTVPIQVNVPPVLKAEGKVNPNAMEQIRLQQLKQQHAQAHQHQQQHQLQQQQQQTQAQQPAQQQKKPEPIYDLPIHNKPTLTPQQQQQIRQQQQQLLQQKLQHQQHHQQQQQQQQRLSQQQALQQAQLHQQKAQQLQQRAEQQEQTQQAQQQAAQRQAQQQAYLQAQQKVQQAQQDAQAQQRQSRAQQQRSTVSLSSRDTSVFSTSSGCSGGSCWRGSRPEDTRDLDALLQYIEGPARHVDRGKKRAKKQRQKAKKMESRLVEERNAVVNELNRARREMDALQVAHAAAKRRLEHTRGLLQAQTKANKKKGKKQKLNPSQQAKAQLVAEQLGELTSLMNTTSKEMQAAEKQVLDFSRRLQNCERQLAESRAVQGKPDRAAHHAQLEQAALLAKQQEMQHQQAIQQQLQQQHHQLLQRQQQQEREQLEQQRQLQMLELKQKIEKQKQGATFINAGAGGGIVCVRRSPGDGAVTVSIPGQRNDTPLAQLVANNKHVTVLNVSEEPAPAPSTSKPADKGKHQTWEQVVAHINQVAKGVNKQKKKHKEPKEKTPPAEQKPKEVEEPQRSNSLPDPQTLSKKQRKQLAKQQAAEEENKKQQQADVKANKKPEAKKPEPPKSEPAKKAEKKPEPEKTKKEKKEEKKKEKAVEKKAEKKGKENKLEKTPPPQPKTPKQPAQPQQQTKKEAKKQQQQLQQQQQQQQQQSKPHVINITPDTTIEVVSKKNLCTNEPAHPASCSIMEQLSCGVQVADLKLPPGITLTRVQPHEKKEPPPIKSVPLWKAGQLPAAPTPVARPAPVINADPANVMFTTAHPEPPKPVIIADPPPPPTVGKSKKAKKKAKKAAAAAEEAKPEGANMVTLRNPMFHANLPPVQISNQPAQKKQEQIRIPDPIPMPPNACQATITPTSNGMYTIRNPLMTMMHQQSMMGVRTQSPQVNPMYGQQYNYTNPNQYNPVPPTPTQYMEQTRASPKPDDFQTRIMNLASFTQKNDEGYSLFKTRDDNQQRSFLTPEYYENQSPKSVVSPNPIGTRPVDTSRSFESDSSLFANPIQRPEPIGTPLKQEERCDYTGLYTPFGQEDRNVFRNALFSDKNETSRMKNEEMGVNHVANGDSLPYFQRLRVGSQLNSEVTIHHVTESKFYKGQEPGLPLEIGLQGEESLFSRPPAHTWPDQLYGTPIPPSNSGVQSAHNSASNSPGAAAGAATAGAARADEPSADERRFGPVGERPAEHRESSVFLPDSSITNLSSLEVSEREIESFKRFDYFFEPPQHKPKVQLDVAALRQNQK